MIHGPEIITLRQQLNDIRSRATDLIADRQPTEAAALLLGALTQVQYTLGRFNDTCQGCERQLPNSGGHVDERGDRWHGMCWQMRNRARPSPVTLCPHCDTQFVEAVLDQHVAAVHPGKVASA